MAYSVTPDAQEQHVQQQAHQGPIPQPPAIQPRPATLQGRQPQMRVMPQPPEVVSHQQQMIRQQQHQPVQQPVAPAAPQQQQLERPNFQMALLPPPQDRLYNDFQDLMTDLRNFTRSQGYAVVIGSSVNRDPSGKYRRYNLSCSKGGKGYQRKSTGQRQSKSHKTGCPMKLKAVQERAFP